MKIAANYPGFAYAFRSFLNDKEYKSPSDFHRDLTAHMGKNAPSLSSVWMAFYGARVLPLETVLFMASRYGFKVKWEDTLQVKNLKGVVLKQSQMALPGMRDLK